LFMVQRMCFRNCASKREILIHDLKASAGSLEKPGVYCVLLNVHNDTCNFLGKSHSFAHKDKSYKRPVFSGIKARLGFFELKTSNESSTRACEFLSYKTAIKITAKVEENCLGGIVKVTIVIRKNIFSCNYHQSA